MIETLGPYRMPTVQYGDSIPSNKLTTYRGHNAANMNLMKNEHCIYGN